MGDVEYRTCPICCLTCAPMHASNRDCMLALMLALKKTEMEWRDAREENKKLREALADEADKARSLQNALRLAPKGE